MDATAVALLLSAGSLLIAGFALGWQIIQWLLSAGRAKPTLMHGLVRGSDAFLGPVGKTGEPFNLGKLQQQGVEGTQVVGIQVINHGRAPLTVERVSLCLRGGAMQLVPTGDLIGPQLPHRLEPGTNARWYVAEDHAQNLVRSTREVLDEPVTGVYMTAALGTGKTVKTRETLRM